MSTANSAKEQVRRLLALLPYLLAHPGARVADVARVFGISEKQLVADLGVLWFCGLPGMMPGDYIEVDMDAVEGEGVIHVSNADYLARPLRLSADEVLSLLVALRVLRESGQLAERELIDRVIARLEEASGQASAAAKQVEIQLDTWEDPEIRATVQDALSRRRRLHLSYWVPTRDETTERDVDPMQLAIADGRSYLEAWCHRAEDVRLFRLDRVAAARVLDEEAAPPTRAQPRDLSSGLFQPSPDDALATLELGPEAAWVSEYYPCERVDDLGDGRLRIQLRVADPRWLRRLALRLGGHARILQPADLAEAVRADAANALAAYDKV
ncbi:helix-turn-helix transcriptional regulator [Flindersiella endophytica]